MNLTKIFFSIYRRLIFLLPPEAAHIVSLSSAEIIYKSWLKDIFKTMNCDAKIKSDQVPKPGKLLFIKGNKIVFEFHEPEISIAPGQACVFYKNDEVLGGGWIKKELE